MLQEMILVFHGFTLATVFDVIFYVCYMFILLPFLKGETENKECKIQSEYPVYVKKKSHIKSC